MWCGVARVLGILLAVKCRGSNGSCAERQKAGYRMVSCLLWHGVRDSEPKHARILDENCLRICVRAMANCRGTNYLRDIRLQRRFTRSAPCKRACRSSSGECEPRSTHVRVQSRVRSHLAPQHKKGDTEYGKYTCRPGFPSSVLHKCQSQTNADEQECCGGDSHKIKARSIQQKARLPNDRTQD